MHLKWLLSFKRRSQAIIHHELSATSFELEIICFVMRRLFIFCKVGIFLYHVSRMCKFSFCCKGREYVTKSRKYVRLTICVKKRKDMQKFFLSFEYFESDEWKWVLRSVRISECPWAFSNFETIVKSDWQTVKAFFTSTVHEITANGFLTYKTTHFQIFFPNLNNNRRMIKNVVSKYTPNVFCNFGTNL